MNSKGQSSALAGGASALVPKRRFPEFQEAEAWKPKFLGALFSQREETGRTDLRLLSLTDKDGIIPQEESNRKNTTNGDLSRYLRVTAGDIAYNTMRMWEGRSALSQLEGIVSPAYTVCAPTEEANSAFFSYYFKTPQIVGQFARYSQGLVKDTLNLKFAAFARILVATPPTLFEQQKIADCLDSTEALIAAQGRKVEALRAHKRALMQRLFPQEGETQPRLRFPEFEGAGEWEEGTISDIGTVLQGYGFPERYQGLQSGDFPFYKVSDISRSLGGGKTFIEEAANYVNGNQLKELRAKPIPAGTTVFAKIGEAIRSNKRAITAVPCLIDNNAAGVKAIKGKATDFFIYLTMEQISLIDHAGGVVPAVNKSAIEVIPVRFPKVVEQQRIADGLTSVYDLIAAESRKLDTLKTHKKGLMQQLFPRKGEDEA